jgi:PPK2 family polyphosphate:nucleotide phosphotransferase
MVDGDPIPTPLVGGLAPGQEPGPGNDGNPSVPRPPLIVPSAPDWRVAPGAPVDLSSIDADSTGDVTDRTAAEEQTKAHRGRIVGWQERLYAEDRQSLLVIFQALDTGGKDGAIRRVFQGVNPQGCRVWSFKVPSLEEQSHDYLWRYHAKAPSRGMISVFNRSHYEEVLVVRVRDLVPEAEWRPRFEEINDFERMLVRNGTTILKFYLHISREEQRKRLQKRLDRPDKHWKFDPGDLRERERWDQYQAAFEEAISRTSTDEAPWHVVPANRKWYRDLVVSRTIADTLERMDPQWPAPAEGLEGLVVPE